MEKKSESLEFTLQPMFFSISLCKDVIRSIFNTIIYQRAIGNVQINIENCELLKKTSYLKVGEENVDAVINQVLDEIIKKAQEIELNIIDVVLEFYIYEENQGLVRGFFNKLAGNSTQTIEKWILPIEITSLDKNEIHSERKLDELDEQLQINIFKIIELCNANIDHLFEDISNEQSKIVKYPFKITYQAKNLIGNFIKKLENSSIL